MPWPSESQRDTEVFGLIDKERERQVTGLQLIASENFTSPDVMEATGSVLTNKYAEGYPGRRYYGGCEHVDVAEQLAIDRLKQLYDQLEHWPSRIIAVSGFHPRSVGLQGPPDAVVPPVIED